MDINKVDVNESEIDQILQDAEIIYNYGIQEYFDFGMQRSIFERGTFAELKTLYGVNNKMAAATFVASRSRRTTPSQRGNVAERSNVQEEQLIEVFAKKHNIWYDNTDNYFRTKYGKAYAFGSESTVYMDSENRKVLKTIDSEVYGSLLDSLYRIIIHNTLFPETTLNVIGFGRSHFGLFEIVAEQIFIEGRYATENEIDKWFSGFGTKVSDGDYETIRYIVSDLLPKNVIFNNGCLFVIDAFLKFKDDIL